MAQENVDLVRLFQAATQTLVENQQKLNAADTYNGDHGTNMVQTFQTITSALEKKKGSSASVALSYAAKQLEQTSTSSSGKLYAQHLAQAAVQFKGKKMDEKGAMLLLQTLIGAEQSAPAAATRKKPVVSQSKPVVDQSKPAAGQGGGDLLGSLLGGLMGGGQAAASPKPSQSPASSGGGDLLSTLLGSFVQGGGLQALAQQFLGGSTMGDSEHRNQSTQMVVNAFLQVLGSMGKK